MAEFPAPWVRAHPEQFAAHPIGGLVLVDGATRQVVAHDVRDVKRWGATRQLPVGEWVPALLLRLDSGLEALGVDDCAPLVLRRG